MSINSDLVETERGSSDPCGFGKLGLKGTEIQIINESYVSLLILDPPQHTHTRARARVGNTA